MSKPVENGVHGTPYVWMLLGAMLAHSPALGAHSETGPGELRIQGGPIERLILVDDDGRQQYFDRPAESIPLPAGTYRLHEVALEGGYVCRHYLAPDGRQIRIEEGRSTVLMLGAPLRQMVRIERWGTWMILDYELTGQGGERYAVREDSEPPRFVLFKGNRSVASGSFHFDSDGACSYLWRPPLRASGQLSVVPSYDLGALGPAEGESTLYAWHRFWSIPGLPLWAALIPALILSRANRAPRVLLILAPVILLYAGWSALARVLPLGPLEYETSRIMVLSLTVGLAVLWLVGRSLTSGTWTRNLLGAMAVGAGIVFLGVLSLSLTLSDRTIRLVAVMSVLMSATVLGHVLSCRAYDRRRKGWRFGLSLAIGTVAASIAAMFVMIVTWCTTYGGWLGDADYILWLTFYVAPCLGAGVFALSLLFALVGLRTCFSTDVSSHA